MYLRPHPLFYCLLIRGIDSIEAQSHTTPAVVGSIIEHGEIHMLLRIRVETAYIIFRTAFVVAKTSAISLPRDHPTRIYFEGRMGASKKRVSLAFALGREAQSAPARHDLRSD